MEFAQAKIRELKGPVLKAAELAVREDDQASLTIETVTTPGSREAVKKIDIVTTSSSEDVQHVHVTFELPHDRFTLEPSGPARLLVKTTSETNPIIISSPEVEAFLKSVGDAVIKAEAALGKGAGDLRGASFGRPPKS